MKILDETQELRLEYCYEDIQLIEKSSKRNLFSYSSYGEPSCGVIGSNGRWVAIGVESLVLWTAEKTSVINQINWVHSLRENNGVLQILTDPWGEDSAIWEVDICSFEFQKVRNFNNYKNKKYTDNIIW